MLPDLWRMADRHVRPVTSPVPGGSSARVSEVLDGVTHHTRADAAFHACDAFRDGERAMAEALASVGAPRLSLFGHIAWELCLDGALVQREGDALLCEVREGITRALERADGEPPADAAARIHHDARKHAPLPEGFHPRVHRMLAELERGPWIRGYAEGSVVAARLEGIRGRLGFAALDAEARVALTSILDDAIAGAAGKIDALLALSIPPAL